VSRGPFSGAGAQTRKRIIDATLETLTEVGIAGTSARAIATRGDFNQALIFYHFGSIPELLLAAVHTLSEERLARYRARVAEVNSLPDLATVGAELHREDSRDRHIAVLAQMLAGATSYPELRGPMLELFAPWTELVEGVVADLVADSPFAFLVPTSDVAFSVTALFVGIELLTALDEDAEREERLFATFEGAAALLQGLLQQRPDPHQP
jgi:AcrR family transcriptional regulator